jgi:hypothetical protein
VAASGGLEVSVHSLERCLLFTLHAHLLLDRPLAAQPAAPSHYIRTLDAVIESPRVGRKPNCGEPQSLVHLAQKPFHSISTLFPKSLNPDLKPGAAFIRGPPGEHHLLLGGKRGMIALTATGWPLREVPVIGGMKL